MIFTETLLLIATQVLLDSTGERGIHFLPLQAVGEMLFLCCQWLKRQYCVFSSFHHRCCFIFPLSIHLPASLRYIKSCASAHSTGWPPEACRDICSCMSFALNRVRRPVLSLSSIKGWAFLRQSWCKEALPRQPSSLWVQWIQWGQAQAVTRHTVWVGVPPSFRLTASACDQSVDGTYLSKKVGLNLLHKNHWWKVKIYAWKGWKMLFLNWESYNSV